MVTRIGGFRRKSRYKLKKHFREKGKIGISRYFQEFTEGERVVLKGEPAVQKGLYHPRFHGMSGVVKKKLSRCYEIAIMDKDKAKTVIVHPVHLKKV